MLFFGRDEQTLELLERLHEKRFLAVVGSSGCGKSSLVRAGLLSKLQASTAMGDRWQVVTLKPGSRPFVELAAALAVTLCDGSGIDVPAFAEALRTGGLTPLLDAIAPVFESATPPFSCWSISSRSSSASACRTVTRRGARRRRNSSPCCSAWRGRQRSRPTW